MEFQGSTKKGCMTSKTNYHISLAEDVLIEIFLPCSVKTLLVAKCVCKQWYAIIRNPIFELNHIKHQKIHNKGRLLVQNIYCDDTIKYNYALFGDETLKSNTYRKLDSFSLCYHGLHMEGPINGLYCLFSNKDRIILWNPALREFKTLPLSHPHFLPHAKVNIGKVGFGIDDLTHDYKLVLIRYFLDKSIYVTVYNLSTDTWRLLDLGDFRLCEHNRYISMDSCFLNGIYHWWDDCGSIVAFDMSKEIFREISGPNFYDPKTFIGNVTVYDDKVALYIIRDKCFELLLMLEEGVWIKKLRLDSFSGPFVIAGMWKNNMLLLTNFFDRYKICFDSRLALLDMNVLTLTYVGSIGVGTCYRISVYYESLVSVNCGTKHIGKCASLNTRSEFLNCYSDPYLYLDM